MQNLNYDNLSYSQNNNNINSIYHTYSLHIIIAFILNNTIFQESRVRLPKRSNVAITLYIIAEISLLYNNHIISLFCNLNIPTLIILQYRYPFNNKKTVILKGISGFTACGTRYCG